MSRRIARLLDESEREVTRLIAKLEDKNSFPSHDARLLADIAQKVRIKLADLNLDPDDTTPEELYQALQVKFRQDSRLFDDYFGASTLDFDTKSAKAVELMRPNTKNAQRWGLKNKAAKDILRQLPPRRVIKHLNYRSVESFLKREKLPETYLAAGYIESDSWLKAHKRLVAKLDQTAFEIRSVSLTELSSGKWQDFDGPTEPVVHNDEIAAIGVWPSKATLKAPLLSIVLLLADSLARYTDLKPSRTTAHLNGVVAWWADMDHLITELSGQTVSLNLQDAAISHLQNEPYDKRQLDNGRAAFWRELVSRYDNLLDTDGLFDESARRKIAGLKLSVPEPAYEFAEEI